MKMTESEKNPTDLFRKKLSSFDDNKRKRVRARLRYARKSPSDARGRIGEGS